jgi:hypothetical protein
MSNQRSGYSIYAEDANVCVHFDTGNAAFSENAQWETARILREIAARIEQGNLYGFATDSNGNTVGEWYGPDAT